MVEAQITQSYNGIESVITYNDPEHIKHVRLTKNWHEIHMLDHIARLGKMDGDILDVGANVGQHSVFFATHCTSGYVYAYEPNAESFMVLSKNKHVNKLENIFPFLCAIGKKGKGYIVDKEGRSGTCEVERGKGEVEIFEPPIHENKISLIKIDVEGMELEVLEVLSGNLEKWHPEIYVETHNNLKEVKSFLSKFGYQMWGVFNNAPTYWFR